MPSTPPPPPPLSSADALEWSDDQLIEWLSRAAPPAPNGRLRRSPQSALDPPFEALEKRVQALADGLEAELAGLRSGFSVWADFLDVYGYDPPERLIARAIAAGARPELAELAAEHKTLSRRQLCAWLLEHGPSRRILEDVCAWSLAGIMEDDTRNTRALAMLRNVFDCIVDEVIDLRIVEH
jgi:hypothetical protein